MWLLWAIVILSLLDTTSVNQAAAGEAERAASHTEARMRFMPQYSNEGGDVQIVVDSWTGQLYDTRCRGVRTGLGYVTECTPWHAASTPIAMPDACEAEGLDDCSGVVW